MPFFFLGAAVAVFLALFRHAGMAFVFICFLLMIVAFAAIVFMIKLLAIIVGILLVIGLFSKNPRAASVFVSMLIVALLTYRHFHGA